ncbi:MAG: polysaccharide pyruvyl transferase family protein [Planctomycetota bacterium]
MTIEICGGGFDNKGADLMLRTTLQKLATSAQDRSIAIESHSDSMFRRAAQLGVASIYPTNAILPRLLRSAAIRSNMINSLLMSGIRQFAKCTWAQKSGTVAREACDGLLDISGYVYGDKFPHVRVKSAMQRMAPYVKRERPIIFLPQMFGPFDDSGRHDSFRRCFAMATRIYARDRKSFSALSDLMGHDERLRIAPDLTIFSSLSPGSTFDAKKASGNKYACIVPNQKLDDAGLSEWDGEAFDRWAVAGKQILASGLDVSIVIHSDEPGDRVLADRLYKALSEKSFEKTVSIYHDPDPFRLKSYLANSQFAVASRYHALVGVFSSGVPAVVMGWAHKYDELAEEFCLSEFIHRRADGPDHLESLIRQLLNESYNQKKRRLLINAKESMENRAQQMWDDVLHLIGQPRKD